MQAKVWPAGTRVHYVPGEVCVLTESEQPSDPARWYEEVRRHLNVRLAEYLPKAPVEGATCVERDLLPRALQRDFRGDPQVLQPLSRPDGRVNPWVQLARPGALNSTLHFYRIGRPDGEQRDQIDWVRQLVNVANAQFLGPLQTATVRQGRLITVTPNWLSAGTSAEFTEGGPGARPEPAPAGHWTFRFGDAGLDRRIKAERKRPKPSNVVVAVLDTSPSLPQVQAGAAAASGNYLLQRAAQEIRFDGALSVLPSYFQHLAGYVVNWNRQPVDEAEYLTRYPMPDHGLFAAGIIADIAPAATIHLVRVLNDWGVGDLLALTLTLSRLPEELHVNEQQRLVINLSLVVDLPPLEQLQRLWWPETSQEKALSREGQATVERTLTALHSSLAEVIAWLANPRTLIVAAAGNDATAAATRPEPRLPARYDSGGAAHNVLGVAAIARTDQPSDFSNEGGEALADMGVATFGGNATRVPGEPSQIDVSGSPVDAVVGIFGACTLPISGAANATGWAYWAGTSFATPIMSALAAAFWMLEPSRSAEEIIGQLRSYATMPGGTLLCPALHAYQEP